MTCSWLTPQYPTCSLSTTVDGMPAQRNPLGKIKVLSGAQMQDRLRVMFGQVQKSIRDPMTRTLAVQMILDAGCPGQNQGPYDKNAIDECEIAAIYWGFKNGGRYTGDIWGIDTYQTLARTAALGQVPSPLLASVVPVYRSQVRAGLDANLRGFGMAEEPQSQTFIFDCDDATIALMALLMSVGFRAGAKVVSADGTNFAHVYAVVETPKFDTGTRKIVPLDATEHEAYPGWEPPKAYRRAERIYWYAE